MFSHHPLAASCKATVALALMLLGGCERRPAELALSGPTMGTTYTVKVVQASDAHSAAEVRTAIEEILARVDRQMSGYRADSEISKFNAAPAGEWIDVSADVAQLVALARTVSEQSRGAFDVTVAPLVAAWGFGPTERPGEPPDAATIAGLRAQVGYDKLRVREDPPALRKDADLTVDLNAIAPGYAVDMIADRLHRMGVERFMVELGGEVRARGRNASGEPWKIAVERPDGTRSRPYVALHLDDAAIATSGEYRNYYVRQGRRYSHTIDPSTGRPVEHRLASVVVIADSAAVADAWATAYNVLGEKDGYALAEKLHMPVMFIMARDGGLSHRMTREFGRYRAQSRGKEKE